MGHPALDIENWQLVSFEKSVDLSYNHRSSYIRLDIDAIKLYFFLRSHFGLPIVDYQSMSHFFPEKDFTTGREWCFVFINEDNFAIVVGDDKVSITILSIKDPPEKVDFDIFTNNVNSTLEGYNISTFNDQKFNVYLNYSFLLKESILESKTKVKKKLPFKPKLIELHLDEIESDEVEIEYEKFEYRRDYNTWTKAIIDKATASLQLQMLLPIYLESLFDLTFRNKLKGKYFDKSIRIDFHGKKLRIFDYFERLPINQKLKEIGDKCCQIKIDKLEDFSKQFSNLDIRRKRNKLLHGNSLFLQDLNLNYYLDGNYIIGFSDRHNAIRQITESFESVFANNDILHFIRIYDDQIDRFFEIFDDNGYFENLVNGIVFGHNPTKGGTIKVSINRTEDLFMPGK